MTFTSIGSPTLPTANTTSSLVATRNATFTVSGSVITLVSFVHVEMAELYFDQLDSQIRKHVDLPSIDQPRPGDPNGGDDGFPSESNFVFGTPTTTITDAPLPSNTAYPWGGLGPIFRPHDKLEPEKGVVSVSRLKGRKVHAA
ncbi:hypothetical protein LZ31DRAFT_544025 [Colletotrichum somersetense]|nr:hypothetical protein LZ31DRAFT_544025 [Colletotrichum somersetense]